MRLDSPKMQSALRVGKGRAGLAMIDLQTGGLLALASTPQFDLRSIRDDWSRLADPELHPERPLNDYAVEAWESPGSTVKPLIALAALHSGALQPNQVKNTEPGYMVRNSAGVPVMRDHAAPGNYTTVQAIAKSSNVFFARLVEIFKQRKKWRNGMDA